MVGVLGAALALSLSQAVPGVADEETAEPPAVAAPADPAAPADGGSADSGDSAGDSGGSGNSYGYGGGATGPDPLPLLPDDPAYPVPEPLQREGLPDEVDVVPPWQNNEVCDPVDRPGMVAFANLVSEHYNRPYYSTSRTCLAMRSEHYDGRAVDWALNAHDPADRRIGDAVVTWLTENDGEMAKRFGIQSIIWNSHVWRAYESEVGWRGYVGQSAHADHIHFSFTWDGAAMRTSWWTGIPVEQADLGPCVAGDGRFVASRAPRLAGCNLGPVAPQDGEDASGETEEPVGAHDPAGPTVGTTPDYMQTVFTPYLDTELAIGDTGEGVELLQKALGTEPDGVFGPQTAEALREYAAERPGLRAAGSAQEQTTDTLTWLMLEQDMYPTLPVRSTELTLGDDGPAVMLLQNQFDLEADGQFGPMTEQAVKDAQLEAGLAPTGVVDGATWQAVDAGKGGEWTLSSDYVDALGWTWVDGSIALRQSDLPVADQ
ncbi:peptidoglycan-binding domain-containing protein [Ornithinicoccus hortensis]|nr:peptidoglycan-binding protein [Ornithinicoccus hortensis]